MRKIVQHNTETLPAPEGRAGLVLAAHSDQELRPLRMANWFESSTSMACLCCLRFWSYLYVSYFGLFHIIVQETDTASDLDRSAYMQNCDPKEVIYFNFCVVQFSPQVFFSQPSASGQKTHFPPCCSTLMAFLCPIDPENKPSLLISSGEFIWQAFLKG